MPMFMVLSPWQSHCESSPGSFDECRTAPSGRRPKTKPNDLGCESACRLPESTPTIAIFYYYYSAQKLILILPSRGGEKAESTPILILTAFDVAQLR